MFHLDAKNTEVDSSESLRIDSLNGCFIFII